MLLVRGPHTENCRLQLLIRGQEGHGRGWNYLLQEGHQLTMTATMAENQAIPGLVGKGVWFCLRDVTGTKTWERARPEDWELSC